jgi:prepilin-type N-terminal cleavage/methylation domain-containing protein
MSAALMMSGGPAACGAPAGSRSDKKQRHSHSEPGPSRCADVALRRKRERQSIRAWRGFTIIELLVVVAIIALLVGLMLPAVQQARETARRVQCRSNLLQLGLALRNYETTHDCLPPGSVDPNRPIVDNGKGYHFGWIVQILPQLEQTSLFSFFDFSVGLYDVRNTNAAMNMKIPLLSCPAKNPHYPGDYAGCHHDVEAPIDVDNHGVLFLNSSIRQEDIADGTSHTLFVGETSGTTTPLGWAAGTRQTLRNTGTPINGARLTPGGASPVPAPGQGPPFVVGGFSSPHNGGANFVLGDGSGRFINQMVSIKVFRQLGHRADGELPAGEF